MCALLALDEVGIAEERSADERFRGRLWGSRSVLSASKGGCRVEEVQERRRLNEMEGLAGKLGDAR